ncbi:hypothetical protein HPP92_001738 [Vanilla planifolia]|uniref:BZIP transcription factor n=1 Tax=Vanilla planifolia TaxID=51239 RepID=A0A835VFM1_VANPL|nr:hypothetical protein HPP92_001738 [Vanilla planifolia]
MGCGGSKLEEQEAVVHCRGRTSYLVEAIRHRYELANAHAAYADSLLSVGAALHGLLDGGLGVHAPTVLPLPTQRKGDHHFPQSPAPPPPVSSSKPQPAAIPSAHSHSRSQSGSHIHFHSDEDSDFDGESPLHSDADSPVHLHPDHHETTGGSTYVNIQYARNNPPPSSVAFEQRVGSPKHVQFDSSAGPSSSSSHAFPYAAQNTNYNPFPSPYAYQPNYYGYGGMGSLFGNSSPPPATYQDTPSGAGGSSKISTAQAAPPLPPPPPRTSAWDFLNLFEPSDNYYQFYTPGRSSKELREDEGIPDLEEDEQEVIKQAYGDQKFVASTSADNVPEYNSKKASVAMEDVVGSPVERSRYHPMPKDEDEDVVVKSVVGGEVQNAQEVQRNNVASRSYHDASEVANEIRAQFERAAESTKELTRMLEVGKHPYKIKRSVYSVSSMMTCVIPISMSKDEDLDYEEDRAMRTGNLSSTLRQLLIWEQKLHDEVRVEEKLRLFHDRNRKKLQHLDDKGAEAHKIDATETLIRKLSTKIRIEIEVINTISTKINVLRDEELWPQIDELIQGFEKMWKVMWECHQIQRLAVSEANYLDSIASGGKINDAHMNAMMQLEVQLLRWIGNFSALIHLQKNFVKDVNGWLVLCLHYEPEITADGVPPYSPGRIGAPPVFVIFNCWSQALDRLSEKEVLDSMQAFASSVKQLWQQNDVELRQKMISNREMEIVHKKREREAQLISHEVEALHKKLVATSIQNGFQLDQPINLQSSLRQVFEAMENFTINSVKAYEDLCARAVEEKAAIAEAKGSQV